jgi:hypothetical protein
MSTIVTRTGKGSALTYAEVDANFTNLNSDKLQSTSSASILTLTSASIAALTVTSSVVTSSSISALTATSSTLTNPTVTNYTESVVTVGNSGTAKTLSLTSGTVQTVTLTGSCTFTMPTATEGKSFVLLLKTGAGSFTATFTGVKFSGGTAPTITATASKMDILTFVADGTNWYGSFVQNYTP